MIWHIYSHLYCFSRDGGRNLPSSGEAAPTMGQVPCEFQADWLNFIFQLMAPDVIWHIYLHLYCFLRDGGRDLLSSGEAAPTMGKVPCEFWADWPGCSFSGEEFRQGSFQPCPAQDGASSMAGSSRHDLVHLLTPVLFIKGLWQGLADWPAFIFQLAAPNMIWHIYSGQCCLTTDGAIHLPFSGEVLLGLGKVSYKSPGECSIP